MASKGPQVFETSLDTYTEKTLIGQGGSGRVYLVENSTGQRAAVKLLDPAKASTEKKRRFKNELSFGLKNRHKHIISIIDHGVATVGSVKAPFYVMNAFESSLRASLTQIERPSILKAFAQFLDGVEAAHLVGVFHRDIKPENILCDKGNTTYVLADFGIAHFEEEDLFTAVETKAADRLANFQYAAPEQRTRGGTVDHRADIYALGLILNEMFTKEVPQGTGFKLIGGLAPEYSYLDDVVALMIRQAPTERPKSIEAVKALLVARGNEFVVSQQLNRLSQVVLPVSDIDDPIVSDPPRLVNVDWKNGVLTLILHREINGGWVTAIDSTNNITYQPGKHPREFRYDGNRASIQASESEAQATVNYFKQWLPNITRRYGQLLAEHKASDLAAKRKALAKDLEEQQRRERILKNLKI